MSFQIHSSYWQIRVGDDFMIKCRAEDGTTAILIDDDNNTVVFNRAEDKAVIDAAKEREKEKQVNN